MTGTHPTVDEPLQAWLGPGNVTRYKQLLAQLHPALLLLQKFNARTNLVGDASLPGVVGEHVVESVAAALAVEASGRVPTSVVDVGAGAGLETLALACWWPDCAVTAIEPRRKRADFIELAADRAGVGSRITVIRESLRKDRDFGVFDVATSRATFSPTQWLELARDLVAPAAVAVLHAHQDARLTHPDWHVLQTRDVVGTTRKVFVLSAATDLRTAPKNR